MTEDENKVHADKAVAAADARKDELQLAIDYICSLMETDVTSKDGQMFFAVQVMAMRKHKFLNRDIRHAVNGIVNGLGALIALGNSIEAQNSVLIEMAKAAGITLSKKEEQDAGTSE